jgi:predicted small metal-binding protein
MVYSFVTVPKGGVANRIGLVVLSNGNTLTGTFPFKGDNNMMKFACKDLGIDCNFVATGATKEDVLQKAMAHGNSVHGAMMKNMSKEQMTQFGKQLETSIKAA